MSSGYPAVTQKAGKPALCYTSIDDRTQSHKSNCFSQNVLILDAEQRRNKGTLLECHISNHKNVL